jgi:hypothetical protein
MRKSLLSINKQNVRISGQKRSDWVCKESQWGLSAVLRSLLNPLHEGQRTFQCQIPEELWVIKSEAGWLNTPMRGRVKESGVLGLFCTWLKGLLVFTEQQLASKTRPNTRKAVQELQTFRDGQFLQDHEVEAGSPLRVLEAESMYYNDEIFKLLRLASVRVIEANWSASIHPKDEESPSSSLHTQNDFLETDQTTNL